MNPSMFPNNLLLDIGAEPPQNQPEDFLPTLMYVLRCVSNPRDSRAILMRYKDGKSFDEIADTLKISKQRASYLINEIVGNITGDYAEMLSKGIKQYMDDMLALRLSEMDDVLADSEREAIEKDAYANGYDNGYADGLAEKKANSGSINVLNVVNIDTLSLSVRTYNALSRNGVKTLGDVVMLGDGIANLHTFGKICFDEIARVLMEYNVDPFTTFPKAVRKYEWRITNE